MLWSKNKCIFGLKITLSIPSTSITFIITISSNRTTDGTSCIVNYRHNYSIVIPLTEYEVVNLRLNLFFLNALVG